VALYGHWICPFVSRVQFALGQRGVSYTLVNVPPTAARPKGFVVPEAFLAHSPKGEVPLLQIDEDYLADSLPILWWMEERLSEPSLLPSDTDGIEQVRERMAWINHTIFPPMIGVYYGVETSRIAAASSALSAALYEMSQWLEHDDWLTGSAPSLSEAALVSLYVRLDGLRALGFDARLPRQVEAHRQRCQDLPGWSHVAWSQENLEEYVGRFTLFRERARERSSD